MNASPGKLYGAALALIAIDRAATSYQLVDLKAASRRAVLRRAAAFSLDCEFRAFPGLLAARFVVPLFRIDNLPALNRRLAIGAP
jgi:hypothetical protein